jgi:hypothetical protein
MNRKHSKSDTHLQLTARKAKIAKENLDRYDQENLKKIKYPTMANQLT